MKYNEIKKRIYALKTDEDIYAFINERLGELEKSLEEKSVGQGYTASFSEFIGRKIHYKVGDKIGNNECPDLVYDDIIFYFNLIKTIKENKDYFVASLMNDIMFELFKNLSSIDFSNFEKNVERGMIFELAANNHTPVSIKEIKEKGLATCADKAGMAHNFFKFLGIDSELVCGAISKGEKELHAYNLIFPNGYGNMPAIIYDCTRYINYENISLGFFKALTDDEYNQLLSGEPLIIDMTTTENYQRRVFGLEESKKMKVEPSTYVYGLENGLKFCEGEARK